ncbi:unnamed protein product [Cuscuta campestris]|uniref:HMG box domain-containing protein n=1 Tax=Cuscuta campestris TaxID=132261 RepID=A0A484KDQ4_9ASTE|nr:unnamed protein product [Cuscuta campestris]
MMRFMFIFRKSLVIYDEPKKGELAATAFRIFLKEMRRQNPTWKYAKVKKAASRKWKSFFIGHKAPYMRKAQNQIFKKMTASLDPECIMPPCHDEDSS